MYVSAYGDLCRQVVLVQKFNSVEVVLEIGFAGLLLSLFGVWCCVVDNDVCCCVCVPCRRHGW